MKNYRAIKEAIKAGKKPEIEEPKEIEKPKAKKKKKKASGLKKVLKKIVSKED